MSTEGVTVRRPSSCIRSATYLCTTCTATRSPTTSSTARTSREITSFLTRSPIEQPDGGEHDRTEQGVGEEHPAGPQGRDPAGVLVAWGQLCGGEVDQQVGRGHRACCGQPHEGRPAEVVRGRDSGGGD